jgi:hypothetical protein
MPDESTAIHEPEMRESAMTIPMRAYIERFAFRSTDVIE